MNLSVIQLGEIFYIFGRERSLDAAQKIVAFIKQLPIAILPADEKRVLAAARYKMSYPISYADAFAVAAAVELEATLVTRDPELAALEDVVHVEFLQRNRQ